VVIDKSHPEAGFVELEPLAIGGLDLVLVFIGMVAMLFFCAGWIITSLVVAVFQPIGIGFIRPFNVLAGLFNAAMRWEWGQIEKHAIHFGRFFWSQIMMIWRFVYVVGDTLLQLSLRITGVSQTSQDGLAQLRAKEQTDIDTLDRVVAADVTALHDQEVKDVANLNLTIAADVGSLSGDIVRQFNRAETDATAANNTLQATLNARINTLNNRITQVNTGLTNTINADVSTINTTIRTDVNSLTAADATNLRTAENFATGLVSGLGIGALRSTITALQSQVSKIATETTECLDPLCDTVTPQAQRLGRNAKNWQNLEDLGVAAILVAMGAELLTNPGPVVSDIGTVVNDVGQPLVSAARDLIGA
jgi:hypothetical protein